MKRPHLEKKIFQQVFLLALCLALAGCVSKNWQASDVPTPASTPFDSDQLARAAYLDGFRTGYRAQRSGNTLGVHLEGGPYLHARQLGFQAGAAHARAQLPDSAPATQIYQAR